MRYASSQTIAYQTGGAAGIDLAVVSSVVIPGNGRLSVGTGVVVAIPDGHVGLLRSRSSLAFSYGILCFEGTIDSDYRGEIRMLLWNMHPTEPARLTAGQRVSQLVIVPFFRTTLERVDEIEVDTARGAGGFGSTG